jgi:hypothetical protein
MSQEQIPDNQPNVRILGDNEKLVVSPDGPEYDQIVPIDPVVPEGQANEFVPTAPAGQEQTTDRLPTRKETYWKDEIISFDEHNRRDPLLQMAMPSVTKEHPERSRPNPEDMIAHPDGTPVDRPDADQAA